jgi:hypothetical protein
LRGQKLTFGIRKTLDIFQTRVNKENVRMVRIKLNSWLSSGRINGRRSLIKTNGMPIKPAASVRSDLRSDLRSDVSGEPVFVAGVVEYAFNLSAENL